ncbi:MAG: hypothetical protein ABEJ26_00360 [Halosimplex sp.]
MASFPLGDAFALFVVTLSYLPVLRAYALERSVPRLVAAHTALLVGRVAAVAAPALGWPRLALVEYGVGVALAGLLFAGFCYREWHTGQRTGRFDAGSRFGERGG